MNPKIGPNGVPWLPEPIPNLFERHDVQVVYVRDGWKLTAHYPDGRTEAADPEGAAERLTRRAAELGPGAVVRGDPDTGLMHVLGVVDSLIDTLYLDRPIYDMEEDAQSPRTRRWALKRAAELWASESDDRFAEASMTTAMVADRPGPAVHVSLTEIDRIAFILEEAADYWSCNRYASDTTGNDDHILGRLADAVYDREAPALTDIFAPA